MIRAKKRITYTHYFRDLQRGNKKIEKNFYKTPYFDFIRILKRRLLSNSGR